MTPDVGLILADFIYESAPFPSCHASTIVETSAGLVTAFFGGTREGAADVGIWLSRRERDHWTPPVEVATGVQPDGSRQPCWNPVLVPTRHRSLLLFYKVGPSPSRWWGMVQSSEDGGRSWSPATRLPAGLLGPAKNKSVQLAHGTLLSPCSVESSEGWRIYFERSSDDGLTWNATQFVEQDSSLKALQPTILIHSPTRLQALGRTRSGRIFETWSHDAGRTWSQLTLTDLPNCNSGIDAVTLQDGRHLLVYNHSNLEKVRYPLNVAVSLDGRAWHAAAQLESEPPGQYSYPAVIQANDGPVHVTYTWKRRRIRHVVLDPAALELRPISAFTCPPPGSPTHRGDPSQ